MNSMTIGLDFETYGDVNLPVHGLDRYSNGEHFRPTLACTFYQGADGQEVERTFDFVEDYFGSAKQGLLDELKGRTIVAHNAPFEQAVLAHPLLGTKLPHERFIDSAVVARAAGAGSRLEQAAPQLLGVDKMAEGRDLIKLFAIPGKYQEANGSDAFDPDIVEHNPIEWQTFKDYCLLDARLGYYIVKEWDFHLGTNERAYTAVTSDMNDVGWKVDMAKVEEMQRRYLANMDKALAEFRARYETYVDEKDLLNFRSFPQLKEFCRSRGVNARSFDEEHVTMLLTKVAARLDKGGLTPEQTVRLNEVEAMLQTKQILGGSSLSKLQKIEDLVGPGDRLRGSYVHVGAAQTLRTSGKGVQMQNLKRLAEPMDMSELDDPDADWSNDELAVNLRQVFTASDPDGALIVGDFSSVESRGLAWAAGADWKIEAFRNGKDLYKVLAAKIFSVHYDDVLKPQRQTGKVGELSCGYGAGPGAVKDFAAKMGVAMTAEEAASLVNDWRAANPEVVILWERLDSLLMEVVRQGQAFAQQIIGNGLVVSLEHTPTPVSLQALDPNCQSIMLTLRYRGQRPLMRRVFHGAYMRGRNVGYWKPAKNKTGAAWVNHYRHPKSKEIVFYNVYGGKLSGILTQSMCREMFFSSLAGLHRELKKWSNVDIVGQFHDEIVLDWRPRTPDGAWELSLEQAKQMLNDWMSSSLLPGFPLAAEIKHDYRYTK